MTDRAKYDKVIALQNNNEQPEFCKKKSYKFLKSNASQELQPNLTWKYAPIWFSHKQIGYFFKTNSKQHKNSRFKKKKLRF